MSFRVKIEQVQERLSSILVETNEYRKSFRNKASEMGKELFNTH
jgi:hypothetical protein